MSLYMKFKLKINQRIYVKKNSRRFVRCGGKRFSVPSEAYQRSKELVIRELHDQIEKRIDGARAILGMESIFKTPMAIETEFWYKGNARIDADNLHTSILDILQDAHIIESDHLVFEGHYSKHLGADDWRCEVTIETL